MMKRLLIGIVTVTLLAACNSGDSAVEQLSEAIISAQEETGTTSYSEALDLAESLSAEITDYSTDNAARIQAGIVAIVNACVDADSVDNAERAMRLYLSNHDAMQAADSAKWAKAGADVEGINGHLNVPGIVESYRRSITGIEVLKSIKN